MVHKPLGDDVRHDFVCAVIALPALVSQREGKRASNVSGVRGRELVCVGPDHAGGQGGAENSLVASMVPPGEVRASKLLLFLVYFKTARAPFGRFVLWYFGVDTESAFFPAPHLVPRFGAARAARPLNSRTCSGPPPRRMRLWRPGRSRST